MSSKLVPCSGVHLDGRRTTTIGDLSERTTWRLSTRTYTLPDRHATCANAWRCLRGRQTGVRCSTAILAVLPRGVYAVGVKVCVNESIPVKDGWVA